MSARPERRRSSLSGTSPIAPPPAATEPAPPAAAPASAPTSQAAAEEIPTGAGKPRSKYPPKASFYQEREDTDRIRGAIMHTIPCEGTAPCHSSSRELR